MEIYIDESGGFIPRYGAGSSAAAVVGLVVPSERRALLAREFRRLRKRLRPNAIEMKGSSVTASEAAEFCRLLHRHDVLLEAIVIDLGAHSDQTIDDFKIVQARRTMEDIGRNHNAATVEEAWTLSERLRIMPNQLFVQAMCAVALLKQVFETARTHFALRAPRELGSYSWQVDAKADQRTAMEEAWCLLALVTLSSVPAMMLPGGDYSYDSVFAPTKPESPKFGPDVGQIDIGAAIRDRMFFVNSKDSLGVQMADIAAAILTRALNGKLEPPGWIGLSRLFTRKRNAPFGVMTLDPFAHATHSIAIKSHPWNETLGILAAGARSMVPPKSLEKVRAAIRERTDRGQIR